MKPLFTNAAVYEIAARCRTPLRTGNDSNSPEEVLVSSSGRYYLQGTSLAGSLRSWTDSVASADSLFGSQEQPGHLIISDGVFEPDTQTVLRPRVRIDSASGTAEDGGKFDVRHICTGSRFRFTIVWTGMAQDLPELNTVEQMLSALDHGQITLGGQKSNGFGHVSLNVSRRLFDMTRAEDRAAWIEGRPGQPITLPEPEASQEVVFRVQASVPRILVKSGAPVVHTDSRNGKEVTSSYVENIREDGCCVVPGSSFKGAVLTRTRMIADYLGVPLEVTDGAFGRGSSSSDNGKPGRFSFLDISLSPREQKITRIRIDRFTGGVMTGGLFSQAPLCSEMNAEIHAPASQQAACALLLYSLRDLGLGLYNLGSGWAIGWGLPQVQRITAVQGDRTLTLEFSENRSLVLQDPDGLWSQWQKALGGVCHAE